MAKSRHYSITKKLKGTKIADLDEKYYDHINNSTPRKFKTFEEYYIECKNSAMNYFGIYLPERFKQLAEKKWERRYDV